MNTPSRESVLSEWQFNQDHIFPSESTSQGPSTCKWLCQGEGDGGLGVETLLEFGEVWESHFLTSVKQGVWKGWPWPCGLLGRMLSSVSLQKHPWSALSRLAKPQLKITGKEDAVSMGGEGTGDRLEAETYCDFSLEARWRVPTFPFSPYPSCGPHPSAVLMKTLVVREVWGRARKFKRRMEGREGRWSISKNFKCLYRRGQNTKLSRGANVRSSLRHWEQMTFSVSWGLCNWWQVERAVLQVTWLIHMVNVMSSSPVEFTTLAVCHAGTAQGEPE